MSHWSNRNDKQTGTRDEIRGSGGPNMSSAKERPPVRTTLTCSEWGAIKEVESHQENGRECTMEARRRERRETGLASRAQPGK